MWPGWVSLPNSGELLVLNMFSVPLEPDSLLPMPIIQGFGLFRVPFMSENS